MLIIKPKYACIEALVIIMVKLEQLQCTFPKLTDVNQHYILGLTTGLKYVQDKFKEPSKPNKEGIRKGSIK